MSDFLVIRNIKAPLSDVHITGGVPEENVDYSLMVDVSLNEVREKKSTGDENPDKTFIFIPTGDIRLINLSKINERSRAAIQASSGKDITPAGDSWEPTDTTGGSADIS